MNFSIFSQKNVFFRWAGKFKMESEIFAHALYCAQFAFYSANNPRLLSLFVLIQQVQGCARKGVFKKKTPRILFWRQFL